MTHKSGKDVCFGVTMLWEVSHCAMNTKNNPIIITSECYVVCGTLYLFGLVSTGDLVVILPNIKFLYTFIFKSSHKCDFNVRCSNYSYILE